MIQTTPQRITATNCGKNDQTIIFDKIGDEWFATRGRQPGNRGLTQTQVIDYLTNVWGA